MFEDETKKQFLIKLLLSAFVIFAVIFLAFYIVMEIMLHRMADPTYNAKRIERVIKHRKIKSDTVSTVSPSISHEVMGPDAMIFIF